MSETPVVIPDSIRSAMAGYASVTPLPVQWGDQDAFGHVNNVVYFRWFESARIDLLKLFPSSVTMDGTGPGPILASIKCDYRRQLRFPDFIYVGSRISRVGRSSVDISHAVFSGHQNQVVAEGCSVVVIFDYTSQRVMRVPDDLRQLFEGSMERSSAFFPV